jgi:hypothetical protein
MDAHRLRAPSPNGALLAVPPLDGAVAQLVGNAERLDRWGLDFQGRDAARLRRMARAQVLESARSFLQSARLDVPEVGSRLEEARLVVTGHQPELFHPGVWIKNFAAALVARQQNPGTSCIALNLIVDNDVPKSCVVKVPGRDAGGLRVDRVAFDEWAGEVPYEDLDVADESLFATFAERARQVLTTEIADPLLEQYWPQVLGFRGHTRRVGLRFALARRAVEAAWGIHNLEVPLSAVCETEAFLWFTCYVLAQLPRFRAIHNEALARYRARYSIRSRHHPVPGLGAEREWLEAPFWVWRSDSPRRRPLMARQLSRTMQLRLGGEDEPFADVPLSPDREACCAVDQLLSLPARGIRLRTRALTTTMFARYLLGDLFLHGIGGAKYDELGDEISGRFFAIEPPQFLTISLTLWPGLVHNALAPVEMAAAEQELRDLKYNPDRHLTGPSAPDVTAWVDSKRRAILTPVATHTERVNRFREIRRCNEAMQNVVSARAATLRRDREDLLDECRRGLVARNREYSSVVYSRRRLREALEQSLPGLSLAGG